jgi:Acyclic terpene utilisation family protein AtuA
MKTIRIGAGAGFAGDRIDPAVDLARDGQLDYLVFECLAERTIALAQLSRRQGRNLGFDPLLRARMEAVLPFCARGRTRIVTNMGAANPEAAAREIISIARTLGLAGMRVAWVTGDDVLHRVADLSSGNPREHLVSANAYLGVEPILDCLRNNADVIVTGRVADPSLFLAPMVHAFGWALDDWRRLGRGTSVGHLLECAGQLTGGYFADPGYKDVSGLDRLGFPVAEIDETGDALLTKLAGSGGALTIRNCKEQILYEVHDPSRYLTPDVTADFSTIRFFESGPDTIHVSGATGTERPANLKVSAGFYAGFIAEGQISYAGPGAWSRARLARQILEDRLRWMPSGDLRIDFIGIDSVFGPALSVQQSEPHEVRLRAAGRFFDEADGRRLMQEIESLYVNGPAGGSGVAASLRENIAMDATFLPRTAVVPATGMEVA